MLPTGNETENKWTTETPGNDTENKWTTEAWKNFNENSSKVAMTFEEWKNGVKKERTPETALNWGTYPGEVFRFGLPAWSREDYHKYLYSQKEDN